MIIEKDRILLTIPFLAPSVNTYWRRGQHSTYLSKKGRQFKTDVAMLIDNLRVVNTIEPTDKRLKVEIHLHFKGKRKRDVDNYNKPILDSLNNILWLDDEQIDDLRVTKTYNSKDMIEVEIIKL